MANLVERLRALEARETELAHDGDCPPEATANWKYAETCRIAAARIEKLEDENAALAAWQCEFTDGKTGLVYGEGGGTYCAMAKRVQKLEAALRWALPLATIALEDCRQQRVKLGHTDIIGTYRNGQTWVGIQQSEVDALEEARAALEDRT